MRYSAESADEASGGVKVVKKVRKKQEEEKGEGILDMGQQRIEAQAP